MKATYGIHCLTVRLDPESLQSRTRLLNSSTASVCGLTCVCDAHEQDGDCVQGATVHCRMLSNIPASTHYMQVAFTLPHLCSFLGRDNKKYPMGNTNLAVCGQNSPLGLIYLGTWECQLLKILTRFSLQMVQTHTC